MRIHLTVAPGGGEGPARHVSVDCPPGACAVDLARVLGAQRLVVDGCAVPPTAAVGAPPLLHGALVELDTAASDAVNRSLWELWVLAGPDAGQRFPLPHGRSVVGRARSSAVVLTDPLVSRRHTEIEVRQEGVQVRDLGGTNGTWVCDARLSSSASPLTLGDVLEVGRSRLALKASARGTPVVRPDGDGHLLVTGPGGRPSTAPPTIRFPDAPTPPPPSRFPLVALLVPLAMAGVLAAVMRSPTMLLFGLTGPVLSLASWLADRRGRRHGRGRPGGRLLRRRRTTARANEHEQAVAAARTQLRKALELERSRLHSEHPPPAAVLALAETRTAGLWGSPHAEVRLGTGPRRSRLTATGDTAPPHPVHTDVPVIVDLASTGVLGIYGGRREVLAAARGAVVRLATLTSPADVELRVVVDDERHADDWAFAAALPHLRAMSVGGTLDEVAAEVTCRESSRHMAMTRRQLVVLVVDGVAALPGVGDLDHVLRRGPEVGVVAVVVDTARSRLPGACRAVLAVGREQACLTSDDETVRFTPDLPGPAWVARVARAVAPLRTPRPHGAPGPPPPHVRLLDALGETSTSVQAMRERWATQPRSTRAVLGATGEGPLQVDLSADGPHVLVAGTTGAGKSELLQTLVCSLALVNRPDDMNFLLVDYKGGAAFRGCSLLPHVVGVVTDLDGHLTARALVSLTAELRRRERLLAEVGAGSLDEYLAATSVAGDGPPPPFRGSASDSVPRVSLPRLVIVIDEYRVLAEELPDFVHGLVRLAAVGRSLGVHLVLATQRPGGVVSADIRANVSLRIALRVRDRADSVDVLDAPNAADLDAATPGRAWLRGAATGLTCFQTARVTGGPPSESRLTVTELAPWWRTHHAPPPDCADPPPGWRDLDRIVAATRAAAASLGIPKQRSPWLPPLPDLVDAAALLASKAVRDALPRPVDRGDGPVLHGAGSTYPTHTAVDHARNAAAQLDAAAATDVESDTAPDAGGDSTAGAALTGPVENATADAVAVGLEDDPGAQRQAVWCWSPAEGGLGVAGGAGSGRTTALLTVATALARTLPPTRLHLFALGRAFAVLEPLPHVAAVASVDDAEHVRLVLATLRERLHDPAAPTPGCWTIVVVDGWEQLSALGGGLLAADLRALLESDAARGLRAVVAGGRSVLAGQLLQVIPRRLVLPVRDPVELALAGIPPKAVPRCQPPGRALDAQTHREVQVAHHGPLSDVVATVAARWSSLAGDPRLPSPVRRLPTGVARADLTRPAPPGTLAVGVREGDLATSGFAPGMGERRVVVVGRPGTGRTSALASLGVALAESGHPVVVLGTHLARAIDGHPTLRGRVLLAADGRGDADRDRLVAARRAHPDLALLVDDAERLASHPVEPVLLEIARRADEDDGVVAAATTFLALEARLGALAAELARAHTGLLLAPTGPTHALGVTVPPHGSAAPGRGVLVTPRGTTRIQVARVSPP